MLLVDEEIIQRLFRHSGGAQARQRGIMAKVNVYEINETEDIALVTTDKEGVTNSYEYEWFLEEAE